MDIIYNYINNELNNASTLTGGPLRQVMGELVENMIDLIWQEMQKKYPNVNSKITVGKKTPIKITNKGGSIEESVDRHGFINGKMVIGIECKTYLDKCYLQRADSDFALMKEGADFEAIIVSLENAVSDNAFNFFMNRNNIDNVFYLADGKRKSGIDNHISHNRERINKEKIAILVDKIEGYFKEAANV